MHTRRKDGRAINGSHCSRRSSRIRYYGSRQAGGGDRRASDLLTCSTGRSVTISTGSKHHRSGSSDHGPAYGARIERPMCAGCAHRSGGPRPPEFGGLIPRLIIACMLCPGHRRSNEGRACSRVSRRISHAIHGRRIRREALELTL